MARPRTKTQDFGDSVGSPLTEVTMDGFLSSSWPAAAPPTQRPQPPRAPLRKPCNATWEVPALELPMATKKRRSNTSASASTVEKDSPLRSYDELSEEDEPQADEEEDDVGIFALEGAADDDDDDVFPDAFDIGLVGLDDGDDMGVMKGKGMFGYTSHPEEASLPMGLSSSVPMGRFQFESTDNSLGASPILMSVLEQVAQAQARGRADSC